MNDVTNQERASGPISWLAESAIVALLYVAAARLGQLVAIDPGNVTALWPPSAIALAAALRRGWRVAAGIWLGGMAATIWPFFDRSLWLTALAVGAVIGGGILAQAMAGALVTRRLTVAANPFLRVRDTLLFLTLAGIVASLISSTVGTTSLALGGLIPWQRFAVTWWTWYLGDAAGIVLMAPFLLVWTGSISRRPSRAVMVETAVYFLVLIAMLDLVFAQRWWESTYPLMFLVLPFLVWAGFRFGPRGATAVIVVVSALAVWNTARGEGPLVQSTVNESLLLLDAFFAVVSSVVLVVVAALAERRRAEDEVHRLRDNLMHSSRLTSLSEMAGGLAHELAQPLGSIANNAQAGIRGLKNSRLSTSEIEEALADIASEAERAMEVIRSLRLLATRSDPVRVLTDVNALVRQIAGLFEKSVEQPQCVQLQLSSMFNQLIVDPVQIQQALLNLMQNAWDAMSELPPAQRRIVIRTSSDGFQVRVAVEDQGTGLTASQRQRIFEPYYSTKGSGLGLGLNITRLIVESHGGKLSVQENPGGGLTVQFTLPIPT